MNNSITIAGSMELTNQLGMRINARITSIDDAYKLMRVVGRGGWTCGEIPKGGLILPYKMADIFDWSLIGAREIELPEIQDEQTIQRKAVVHRGLIYKRRDCPATKIKGKQMPDMIKYSRGAKDFDGPESKEGDDSVTTYVTLVTFRGGGPIIGAFKKP